MTSPKRDLVAGLADHMGELAVLTDLDGTLAAIRPRPEDVTVIEGGREALAALARRAAMVAVVSGRGIDDLMRIVGLGEIAYAGNHGMEFRHPGADPAPDPRAARHRPDLDRFLERWAAALGDRDVAIEDKGVTLSLHYRRSENRAAAEAMLVGEVAADARERGLVPTPGRMVLEIRPPVKLNKGTAARALVRASGARRAVFIGDDHTDLDAMKALRAMRDEGLIDQAVAVGVGGEEVPAEVTEGADLVVEGPLGALCFVQDLGRDPGGSRRPGS